MHAIDIALTLIATLSLYFMRGNRQIPIYEHADGALCDEMPHRKSLFSARLNNQIQ